MTVSPSKRRMSKSIARLIAVAALSMGGVALAGTAGAQECGTYGPACPTGSGSGSGGDATGTGGPDSGALPDSAAADAGNPPSQAEPPSSPGDLPSNADMPISGPDAGPATIPNNPAPTAAPTSGSTTGGPATPSANPVTVGGVAQTPVAGELGRTGTSASTIAIVAAAVVLLGSALVLGARRRNQG